MDKPIQTVKVGDYLFNPQNGYLLVVIEVYEQPKNNRKGQWFKYRVIKGMIYRGVSTFEQGMEKHNGWDSRDSILTDWIKCESEKELTTVQLLYGEVDVWGLNSGL